MKYKSTQYPLNIPRRRRPPEVRQQEFIDAALRVAGRVGIQGLIRDTIAEEAGVSSALLHRYMGGMDNFRDIVIKTAFERGNTDVLFKSLSIEDFKRLNTNPALTKRLCEFLMS